MVSSTQPAVRIRRTHQAVPEAEHMQVKRICHAPAAVC